VEQSPTARKQSTLSGKGKGNLAHQRDMLPQERGKWKKESMFRNWTDPGWVEGKKKSPKKAKKKHRIIKNAKNGKKE